MKKKELLYLLVEFPKRASVNEIIRICHAHFLVHDIKDTIDAELVQQTDETNCYQFSAYDYRSFYFLGCASATIMKKLNESE